MSANINQLNTQRPKRIAMLVANAAVSTQTGWPVGFWWAEITHPYWEFSEKGYEVVFFSPDGGAVTADAFSNPEDSSAYAADDILSLGFKHSPKHQALLSNTLPLAKLNIAEFDGLFVAGGQSPMITFKGNKAMQELVVQFYVAQKVTALVCHGTCVLLEARLPDGQLLVNGKTWTGFADAEEQYADQFVGQRIQPFWIETEARKLADSNFITGGLFKPFAVRDGHLITGQQQFSGAAAARLVIEALGV
jgi:putative intracellular protease/amidase